MNEKDDLRGLLRLAASAMRETCLGLAATAGRRRPEAGRRLRAAAVEWDRLDDALAQDEVALPWEQWKEGER